MDFLFPEYFMKHLPLFIFIWSLPVVLTAKDLIRPDTVRLLTGTEFFPVRNLTNGSGLSSSPTIDNYDTMTHAAASGSTAWTTNAPGGGSADYYQFAPAPIILFSFAETHQFSDLIYWGYHFGAANGNEGKSFRLEFSEDGGDSFGPAIEVTSPTISRAASTTLPLGGAFSANAIRLSITDNWFENFGGGDRVGIGEFRFLGETPINPAPIAQVARVLDFGINPDVSTRTLAIDNQGAVDDLIVTPYPPDGGSFRFSVDPLVIPAGDTASLAVSFAPSGDGCFSDRLRLATNDPDQPEIEVTLLGAQNCSFPPPSQANFSQEEGTFTDDFELILSADEGASLLYTLDGSVPGPERGIPYSGPISITSTTQVRVASFLPGYPPALRTRSYVKLDASLAGYSSPLPILVVENFGEGSIPNKGWSTATQTGGGLRQVPRQPAFLGVFEQNDLDQRATLTAPADQSSRIGIRVRGTFSSTWTPKPYSVETWKTAEDDDRSIRILGMAEESDWILYYPHPNYDRSLLYNTFIWELSRQTGRWAPEFRFVDLFVNEDGGDLRSDDRQGVYVLLEKPKRDSKRLEFEALSEDGTTGGWLNSINRMDPEPAGGFPAENGATTPQFFHTAGPDRFHATPANRPGRGDDIPRQYNAFINFENPNGYRINPAQRAAIEDWYRRFEDILYDDSRWLDPEEGYREHLDTIDFIDYMQLLTLAKQGDGLLLSMFPWVSSHDRKLRMGPMWDFNNGAYSGSTSGTLYFRPDRLWYGRLFEDPGFQREYEDRWFELRKGPLSNDNMAAILDAQVAEITTGLAGAQNGLSAAIWLNRVSAMKSWLQSRANWIDSNFLSPPTFNLDGGVVTAGFELTMTNSTGQAGTIFYSLDGQDPIESGTAYTGPVALSRSPEVLARVRTTAGNWSALQKATFVTGTPARFGNVTVSEIHYHPDDAHPDTEFIELLNLSPDQSIDLTSATFTAGVAFTFPANTLLAPGERILVVENRPAFEALHGTGFKVAGEFANQTKLDNGGEQIALAAADGSVIFDFEYNDKDPWPEWADGNSFSLTLIHPSPEAEWSLPGSWRTSARPQGSPGTSDALTFDGPASELADFLLADTTPRATPLFFEFKIRVGLDDFRVAPESSPDLASWSPFSLPTQPITIDPEGLATYRIPLPADQPVRFLRLALTPRP